MEANFRHLSSGMKPGVKGYLFSETNVTTYFCGILYNSEYSGVSDLERVAAEKIASLLSSAHPETELAKLDGSFLAVAEANGYVYVLRDRHGTGPSFYYTDRGFSTSLYSLLLSDNRLFLPDEESLASYLRFGYVPVPRSSCKGVNKLAGGILLRINPETGSTSATSLYPFSDFLKDSSSLTLDAFAEQYGALHQQAIQKRLEGQNRVGILLSGGYDSGSNLVALRKVWNGPVQSFSIGFRGNHWSELPVAREMSALFGTQHSEYELDGSEIAFLPEIVKALGDPFVEGGLMVNYAAMKMASANPPDMILGGDGSDQYFGTSGREVALHLMARRTGAYFPLIWLGSLLNRESVESGGISFRLRFHIKRVTDIQAGDQFGFTEKQINSLYQHPLHSEPYRMERPSVRSFDQLYTFHHYGCDIQKTIDQVILFKASKMAEHFGNRLSFPFLDNELYQFLQTVPVHYKCKGENLLALARGRGVAKFLLKYHYKPQLPASVTSKKKQGGFAPMALFFQDPLQRKRLAEYILSSGLCRDFLDRCKVRVWLDSYHQEADAQCQWFWYQQSRSFQYFTLLNLAVWWDIFVSRKEVGLL